MVDRFDGSREMQPYKNGDFVLYSDYAALKAENERQSELVANLMRERDILETRSEKTEQELYLVRNERDNLRDNVLRLEAEAAERALAERAGGRWQVKDFADGWIDFDSAEEALAEVTAMGGALIRPLTTEPAAPEAIAKGLLSDADAKAAKLGKFGHHPDPAIDFEIEVETLQARLIDAKGGISKPGTEPEAVAAVLEDIERAMTFRVGGDPSAVRAKQTLRDLEADAKQAGQPAAPEGRQDDDRIRREMDEILRKQSERDIPFVPSTRPSEQAVTEASRAMLEAIDAELDTDSRSAAFLGRVSRLRAALKAAMEAGR